tara:strand:- start:12 stop:641 length:630 start_codon:yes stop_codon:yes gene_type:complete
MSINYDQLSDIKKTLNKYPNSKLQIVTKNRDVKTITELIDNGYYFYGENKVQEAQEKFEKINDPNVNLHLIGPLQTNKVRIALKIFHCIQTIDRAKLVIEIAKCMTKEKIKTKSFYIQINIGKENQKSGVHPEDLKELYKLCTEKKISINGLMCIPPFNEPSDKYFNYMKSLRDNLNTNLKLSMGMSSDYKVALQCGSNLIRVGSRIFS